jgi:predicted ATPase with chaperone activity
LELTMHFITSLSRLLLPALALAALALATPAPAAAQAATNPSPLSADDISEAQLESFAAAATRVSEIAEQLQSQAQGVEDQAELAALQEKANNEMVAAVEQEGLSVDEYNMIFQVAQADPELNATLMEMLGQQ